MKVIELIDLLEACHLETEVRIAVARPETSRLAVSICGMAQENTPQPRQKLVWLLSGVQHGYADAGLWQSSTRIKAQRR
jgi:hypothetical protein